MLTQRQHPMHRLRAVSVMLCFNLFLTGHSVAFRWNIELGVPARSDPGRNEMEISKLRTTTPESLKAHQLAHKRFNEWVSRVQSNYKEQHNAIDRNKESLLNGPNLEDLSVRPGMIVVDQEGFGDFCTVQDAVDNVPTLNRQRVVIYINAGTYEEKVVIPPSKPYITFWGRGQGSTIITWQDAAHVCGQDGLEPLGTYNSATVAINAPHFVARYLSVENKADHPDPGLEGMQAVALRISGDMAAFYNCAFYGAQDTLYDHRGRHYFQNCYIEGSIDYIFGGGQSLYKGCMLHSIDQTGSLTAQSRRSANDPSGFSFINCTVVGSAMDMLGRAWGPYSRVVYSYTYLGNLIVPPGWSDWDDPSRDGINTLCNDHGIDLTRTVYYGQYKCYGPGADESKRVPWSHELSAEEAQAFMDFSFIDGEDWLVPALT